MFTREFKLIETLVLNRDLFLKFKPLLSLSLFTKDEYGDIYQRLLLNPDVSTSKLIDEGFRVCGEFRCPLPENKTLTFINRLSDYRDKLEK